MNNEELADFLEEAARRLRDKPAIEPGKSRESVPEFAKRIQVSATLVRRMCETGEVFARKLNGKWMIDVKKSDLVLSIKYGNSSEKDYAAHIRREVRKVERGGRPY